MHSSDILWIHQPCKMPLQSYVKGMVATLDPNDKVELNDVESVLHDQQKADSSFENDC